MKRYALTTIGAFAALVALWTLWQGWQSPSLLLRIMQLPTLCF